MMRAPLSPTRYVASVVLTAGAAVALMGMSGPKSAAPQWANAHGRCTKKKR